MNMSYDETVMKDLLRIIPQKGKVEWIGIRSKKKEEKWTPSQGQFFS